jgi:hypothetical protein
MTCNFKTCLDIHLLSIPTAHGLLSEWHVQLTWTALLVPAVHAFVGVAHTGPAVVPGSRTGAAPGSQLVTLLTARRATLAVVRPGRPAAVHCNK